MMYSLRNWCLLCAYPMTTQSIRGNRNVGSAMKNFVCCVMCEACPRLRVTRAETRFCGHSAPYRCFRASVLSVSEYTSLLSHHTRSPEEAVTADGERPEGSGLAVCQGRRHGQQGAPDDQPEVGEDVGTGTRRAAIVLRHAAQGQHEHQDRPAGTRAMRGQRAGASPMPA